MESYTSPRVLAVYLGVGAIMGVGNRQYRSSFTSKIVGELSRPLFRPLLTGSTSVFVFGSGLRLYHERLFGAARTSEQQEALVSNQEFPDNTYQVRLYIMCCWCLSWSLLHT